MLELIVEMTSNYLVWAVLLAITLKVEAWAVLPIACPSQRPQPVLFEREAALARW